MHNYQQWDKLRDLMIKSLKNSCELLKLRNLNPDDYSITISYHIRLEEKKPKSWLRRLFCA